MIRSGTARNVINFVVFQAGWLVCVLFPGAPVALLALLALGLIALHLALISQHRGAEVRFLLVGTALGTLLDGLWFQTGVLQGAGGVAWTPVWLVTIWALFLTTLSHSLAWMNNTRWLPFIFAPIGGPFAYWSASRLGSIELAPLELALPALAAGWLVIFPLLLYLQRRFFKELTP